MKEVWTEASPIKKTFWVGATIGSLYIMAQELIEIRRMNKTMKDYEETQKIEPH